MLTLNNTTFLVIFLYPFGLPVNISPEMEKHQVKGTLLLAKEGINGTIAGNRKGVDAIIAWLRSDSRLADIQSKESYEQEMPFYRSKVKLKKEIVTMGIDSIDPKKIVGTYVTPQDWNALISDQ
jgi:UPF0176 protein